MKNNYYYRKCKGIAFAFLLFAVQYISGQSPVKFAVIGDYGYTGQPELAVSNLVHSWNVDFIITTGDNNYDYGGPYTIDSNIGYYYHDFIFPYNGIHGQGAPFNKFFPSLGNHDLDSLNGLPYYNYFTLPGNERYYDFVKGIVHFFVLNSDPREQDSVGVNSVQAMWLQAKLTASNSRFKIVFFHHPPFSSGQHGNSYYMRWPFKQWGASIVLNGHDHTYERLSSNNFTFIVNGLGGKSIYNFDSIRAESVFRYNGNYGAQLVMAYPDSINFRFYNISNVLIDSYTLPYIPLGIKKIGTEIHERLELFQNYPNPFNPETKIRFSIPILRRVDAGGSRGVITRLVIYDNTGKEVTTLVNDYLSAGTYEIIWNAAEHSSGVNFYSFSAGNFNTSRKMVVIK